MLPALRCLAVCLLAYLDVHATAEGYSGSDLAALCKEAAMAAIRELGPAIATAPADAVSRSPAANWHCCCLLLV